MSDNDDLKERDEPEVEARDAAPEEAAPASATAEGPDGQEAQPVDHAALAAEYLEGWQRERAELANLKKRIEREREQWRVMILGDLLLGLLPILDDFDLALASVPPDAEHQEWLNGVLLIQRKLKAHLESLGLQEIEAVGQPFDPALHEAVTHEHSDQLTPDHVIAVVRKGYQLEDRVLRHALVRVAS